jgi:predicted ABC-type ATPase
VVADETGDNSYTKLADKVATADADGAGSIECHFLSFPTEDALARAVNRAKETGREVPESAIRETHASAAKNALQAMTDELFAYIVIWDNDVGLDEPPKRIAWHRRGDDIFVDDHVGYAKVVAKAEGAK